MSESSWVIQSLGDESVANAFREASRRRISEALRIDLDADVTNDDLHFTANSLELAVLDALEAHDDEALRLAAASVFTIARTLPTPDDPVKAGDWFVRLCCHGILADRSADVQRMLKRQDLPNLPTDDSDWGVRVHATVVETWLRLLRKDGWEDLDAVQSNLARLRAEQRKLEPEFLKGAEDRGDSVPAWLLICEYHFAKAAEILGTFLTQGSVEGQFDIREKLEAQFDRALAASEHGRLMEQEATCRLLAKTANELVANSIWTVTRAVNSRVTQFVGSLVSRSAKRPIFEMLPPQRRTLRDEGLLGSSHRSVVVSLPTSSGKTFIAEFRILQALNQFDADQGWVAYVAPTRALVNQIAIRLRRDFAPLGTSVEKVSPALEVDGVEAAILTEKDGKAQFRILVTTPEKLDLMLRSGWEQKIGRPLTLIVVDEAHGLSSESRGLKLELLLATINRECRHAQFLLLTPFVKNAQDIANWLSPGSGKDISLSLDWTPNDRIIALAKPLKGEKRGDVWIELESLHTTRNTLELPEPLRLPVNRPLGLTHSAVSKSPGKLAAATTQMLKDRGTIIVLATAPAHCWSIARTLKVDGNKLPKQSADIKHAKAFLAAEMGADFPLIELLDYGIAVHHAGLSDDARVLIEWLAEKSELTTLAATTTLAQGVNFPVAGVVFASHMYPYGVPMTPEEFWNIAGRAGRVDQEDLGIIALAACDAKRGDLLRTFVSQSIGNLNSTLIDLVTEAMKKAGSLPELESLAWMPGWTSFVQFLAHTYRQIGGHEEFATQVEQILRGTLGFQTLRKSHKGWAEQLVKRVHRYAEKLDGKPLQLVDATGFSWESVSSTLVRLNKTRIDADAWSPELFEGRTKTLEKMMGVLLEVPELREQLHEVTGGDEPDGNSLSRIVCDWVGGRSLTEMAEEHFSGPAEDDEKDDPARAMTKCCSKVFGKLTQTAAWGLAALQSLTIGDRFEDMPEDERQMMRNLPGRVYYGVNSDEALSLRVLGVPRTAATPLTKELKVKAGESLSTLRQRLMNASEARWIAAVGKEGASFRRVWNIIEGRGDERPA